VTFSLAAGLVRELRAHGWPGNVRELDHLITTSAVFTLADALAAVKAGRGDAATAALLPISAKLVRELLVPAGAARIERGELAIALAPAPTLHALSRAVEIQLFTRAYREAGGDFEAVARRFLQGDAATNARRVRLRFNQLGLRVRGGRSGKK
jgi:DNA-binding NtrC family response regulator